MFKAIKISIAALLTLFCIPAFSQAGTAPYPSAYFAQGGTATTGLHQCGNISGFPLYCPSPANDMTVGTVLASATTIAPIAGITHISGTTPIVNITLPPNFTTGQIVLIPDGIFTTTTAGNIGLASTAVVSKTLIMTYDGIKFYPSY